jgi:Amt family ammonium transporter
MSSIKFRGRAAGIVCLLLPSLALADELSGADTAWILTSTALVLFMTIPGLALFYAGLVRSKNVLSVLMQCFAITCLASLLWFAYGYGLAFGDGGSMNKWIGSLDLFMSGVGRDSLSGTIPETVFVMFQMTFAIITPALVVGGFAERMKFSAMLWFSALWLTLVYLPVCHWVWGGGWLGDLGLLDFAGGTVVHINAGVAAMVAALVMGNRKGFGTTAMPPHNLTMTVAGAAMLWVGWFGFNAGSALAANGDAGMAMLVTHIGAAAGSLAWMFMEWVRHGKPSVLGIVTGATAFIKRTLKIDDSLDVFPVHGVGGVIGTLFAGLFVGTLGGVGLAEGMTTASQVWVQFIGVAATFVWCAVLTWIILKLIDAVIGLRVSSDQETEGLDIVLHDETGYNL